MVMACTPALATPAAPSTDASTRAGEQAQRAPDTRAAEPVRTASIDVTNLQARTQATQIATSGDEERPPVRRGWAMLAAGLAVGLLIIVRRASDEA